MSNNYQWFDVTQMIQCYSFKAAYQLCRQLYRHQFYCVAEFVEGNTRIILLHKCKNDIILYVQDTVYDMLNHRKISYKDYLISLQRR